MALAPLRKRRSDAKLDRMSAVRREALIQWLMEDTLSYPEACERLEKEFGVHTTRRSVYDFWQRHCVPRVLRRSHAAAMGLAGELDELGGNWSEPSKALIRQKFFDVLTAPAPDPEQLKTFATMVAAVERGEREQERLLFQRERNATQERRKRKEMELSKWKFQTNAAELAIRFAKDIKTISVDRSLDAEGKLEAVRQRMFGEPPGATATGAESTAADITNP